MKKRKELEQLGNILGSFLKEKGYATICAEYDVVARWNSIVGERIAAQTECCRAEEGKLYVKVSCAAWRQELTYMKKNLIKTIRKDTGCKTICDIIFY
ncbi:DUF721 domain-containing protein [Chitinispirillales bacterium ANBcel5]|uniref:DUF721 domain-containing protein n=1 Tax=Cellulosispirillum alkaliphilum TaxID=3039283 RepID=UPI002A54D728|nr:DUF721 domain-containing protein [Chitinispirillales bacterium ANBcel5]